MLESSNLQGGKRMVKTVIVYASRHHANTYKLVKALAEKYEIRLINAEEQQYADLSGYDCIGFASGIDFGKFYDSVEIFLERNLPEHKRVFFLYTCAKTSHHFTESVKAKALAKNAVLLGEYGCRGFNTYGPWKLIGGMNRNHPSSLEIAEAMVFFETLSNQIF